MIGARTFVVFLCHRVRRGPQSPTCRALASFASFSQNTDRSKVWNQNRALSTKPDGVEHSHGAPWRDYIEATDAETEQIVAKDMLLHENFISEEEEQSLYNEIQPYLNRLRYEREHWDNAINGYRETERKHWKHANKAILQRVRELAFEPSDVILPYVHILDIEKTGCVKAHVDSIRFCGTTLSGISLLSSSVMRLVCEKDNSRYADVHLKRRSLYIMRGRARYEYTHEVLPEENSFFRGQTVPRDRRISVITRNEPPLDAS